MQILWVRAERSNDVRFFTQNRMFERKLWSNKVESRVKQGLTMSKTGLM